MVGPVSVAPRPRPSRSAWLPWAVLSSLALLLALLAPGHRPQPRLAPSSPPLLALAPRSPWVDRAELADPALIFLQGPRDSSPLPPLTQPEDTPFLNFGPDLRSQPGQPLSLPPSQVGLGKTSALGLLLEPEPQPFLTLGQRAARTLPSARKPVCEIFSLEGELVLQVEVSQIPKESKIHKLLSANILSIKSPTVLKLGIDSYGQQASPFISRSSGDSELDQAVLEWASRERWIGRLGPGSYRLELGP